MDSRDCSVVVVSWNTRDLLRECLDSVRAHAPDAETIVVDNGSADGSAAMVKERYPSAVLVENRENLGFARAVNLGIDRMTRRVVVLLNPDATVGEGTLRELLRVLEADPKVGIAGAQLLDEDGGRQHSFDNVPTLATECLNKATLRALFPGKYPSKSRAYESVTDVESVIGACLAAPRAALDRVGLLDERYFVFLEETDWCLRMRRAGFRVVHVPAAKVVHRQGKAKARRPVLARIEYYRSLFTFFLLHRGATAWAVLRVVRLLKSLLNAVFSSLAMILTLGLAPGIRRRAAVHLGLLGWQILLCPAGIGLRPASLPAPREIPR
jgi:hypothetical protein